MNQAGTKTLLVRAGTPPPRDHALVDDHWCPIQVALERPKAPVQSMVYYGKPKTSDPQPLTPNRWTKERQNQNDEEDNDANILAWTIWDFMNEMRSRLDVIERRTLPAVPVSTAIGSVMELDNRAKRGADCL